MGAGGSEFQGTTARRPSSHNQRLRRVQGTSLPYPPLRFFSLFDIHFAAYLSTTTSVGPAIRPGGPQNGSERLSGRVLCRILDMEFLEFHTSPRCWVNKLGEQ